MSRILGRAWRPVRTSCSQMGAPRAPESLGTGQTCQAAVCAVDARRGLKSRDISDYTDRGNGRIEFRSGETYSPWMLNPGNVERIRSKQIARPPPKRSDVFKLLNVRPLDMWKDVTFLSQFVTEMGYIKRREETGLTHKNQALIGRAIRRARSAGLMG
ncbi:ribosomal protein S18 [Hyaloraphidium curvatum]|nr:ribosomal protein S18 [Hyaloraphidium curvatum]